MRRDRETWGRPSDRQSTGPARPLLALLCAFAAACAGSGAPESEAEPWLPIDISTAALLHAGIEERDVEAVGLRVTLAFHHTADLDLYVTDPLQETVYFANTPTRSGGSLDADRRCDDPPPRAETVYFAAPLPGRYRVGVDYPERCAGRARKAVFLIAIEADGRRSIRRGRIERLVFEPAFWEFEIERREVERIDDEPGE